MSYEGFRDVVLWRSQLGESEIPGLTNHGEAMPVMARKEERIHTLGGDRIANVVIAVTPEYEVRAGDLLDDAEVLEVETVKDAQSNILWRVCYGDA